MKIYSRPDQTVLAESAHTGEVAEFPDIARGWGKSLELTGGIPPMEWFNALGKRNDEAIRYLSQRGISEWSASESYPQGAVSYFNQQLWFALSDNQNSQPQQGAIWQRISFTEQQIKQLISVSSVNGKAGDVNLTSVDLGLGNAALRNVGGEPGQLIEVGSSIPSTGHAIKFGSNNISHLSAAAQAQSSALEVTNLGNHDAPAVMLFHREGHHAYYFGMDNDAALAIGGFSLGNNRYRIYHENFKPQAKDVVGGHSLRCYGDVNDLTDTGFFHGCGLGNAPSDDWLYITVNSHLPGYVTQQATRFHDGNPVIWVRVRINGGWHPWYQLCHTGNIQQSIPAGIPQPWPSATPPAGWLKCNGAAFDKNRYPLLAQAYPSGVLPDLRGEFIRGLDDGRGIDGGRTPLSSQNDMFGEHVHRLPSALATWNEHISKNHYDLSASHNSPGLNPSCTHDTHLPDNCLLMPQPNVGFEAGGIETRPRNIAFLYIVRAA